MEWHADFGSLRKQSHLMSFGLSIWAGPTRCLHPTVWHAFFDVKFGIRMEEFGLDFLVGNQ